MWALFSAPDRTLHCIYNIPLVSSSFAFVLKILNTLRIISIFTDLFHATNEKRPEGAAIVKKLNEITFSLCFELIIFLDMERVNPNEEEEGGEQSQFKNRYLDASLSVTYLQSYHRYPSYRELLRPY